MTEGYYEGYYGDPPPPDRDGPPGAVSPGDPMTGIETERGKPTASPEEQALALWNGRSAIRGVIKRMEHPEVGTKEAKKLEALERNVVTLTEMLELTRAPMPVRGQRLIDLDD